MKKYKCKRCHNYLEEHEVFATSLNTLEHDVIEYDNNGEPLFAFCGPVVEIEMSDAEFLRKLS